MSRPAFLFGVGILLSGCAAQPMPISVAPDHPANPRAEQAPLPPLSNTLAINDAESSTRSTGETPQHPTSGADHSLKHDMLHINHDGGTP